jgi:hypothetical protein
MTDMSSEESSASPLILAGKVNGTEVFDLAGERVGHIEDIAIGKTTGHVAYAILAVGGFLGAGERRYPVPWRMLAYDGARNGYVADLDKRQLREAPSYALADLADVGEAAKDQKSWAEHWGPFL